MQAFTCLSSAACSSRNDGSLDGSEAPLLFVSGPPVAAGVAGMRAVKELKSFAKVDIAAGATQRVHLPLRISDLRHWEGNGSGGHWLIDAGNYRVMVGASADEADLALRTTFSIDK